MIFLLIAIFQAIKQIIVVGCGLIFELFMINFLRKRRAQIMPGQVQLIPWKSEYKNENDITVPLHATLVCLFGLEDLRGIRRRWLRGAVR